MCPQYKILQHILLLLRQLQQYKEYKKQMDKGGGSLVIPADGLSMLRKKLSGRTVLEGFMLFCRGRALGCTAANLKPF